MYVSYQTVDKCVDDNGDVIDSDPVHRISHLSSTQKFIKIINEFKGIEGIMHEQNCSGDAPHETQ